MLSVEDWAEIRRLRRSEQLSISERRTGPAPWKPLTALSGPITLPIEFDPGPGQSIPRARCSRLVVVAALGGDMYK